MEVKTEKDAADFVRRVADYQRVSAILWLIIAILQICSLVGICLRRSRSARVAVQK